jgi:peptide/nickel transport system substrate-binding protein
MPVVNRWRAMGRDRRQTSTARRRLVVIATAGVVATLALAACSGPSSTSKSTKSTGPVTTPLTVLNALYSPPTLDREAAPSAPLLEIGVNVNEPLIRPTPTGKTTASDGAAQISQTDYTGAACASYKFTADNLGFDCTLADIKSAYGNTLSPDDFAYTFKMINQYNKVGVTSSKNISINLANPVTTLDPKTVRINFTTANTLAKQQLGSIFFAPLDSKQILSQATADDPLGLKWLGTHTAGYGAYYSTAFTPNVSVTLTANPNYKARENNPVPTYQTLIFKAAPDLGTAQQLLLSGEAQIYKASSLSNFAAYSKSSAVKTVQYDELFTTMIYFNVNKAPFDNIKVRQAIACALDRDAISQTAFGGLYGPADSLLTPKINGYTTDGVPCLKQDLAKAKSLLAEAGMPNGFSSDLQYSTGNGSGIEDIATLLSGQLAKVGINLKLTNTPDTSTFQFSTMKNRAYNMAVYQISSGIPSATYLYSTWLLPASANNYVSSTANSAALTAQITKLTTLADGSAEQKTQAVEIQNTLLSDLPVVPLIHPKVVYVVGKSVCGYREDIYNYLFWQFLKPC